MIAAVALRISFEIFRTEHLGYVSAVVFNGFVNGIDPATGHDAKPCLISVPVTRERLSSIDLRRVEKIACLRSLSAKISPAPSEMVAIESLVGFHKEAEQLVQEKTDARTVNAIDFAAKLASFLKGCEAITLRTYNVYDPTLAYTTEEGRRYVRVFLTRNSERDIHSFIDKTNGDVLKAATWKAPAKYPRGNIFDAHNGLKWMGPCGAFLLGPGAASVMC